jgi:pyridoxamine 5'-phosphate oxidase
MPPTSDDPLIEFSSLLAQARATERGDPTACALSTARPDGQPSVRIVLLKGVGHEGFTFFTNYESRKAAELDANPRAALCFYWSSLDAQVRVEGRTARISRAESEEYFASRQRESQLGAWASSQSAELLSRDDLLQRFREMEARFAGQAVPCPPHWGGYRLTPSSIEFWRSREFRMHERRVYTRTDTGWDARLLYP